jgi:chemotaxis response regulator CheB
MPKAAAEMNAADKVLPLNEIVPAMIDYFAREQLNA